MSGRSREQIGRRHGAALARALAALAVVWLSVLAPGAAAQPAPAPPPAAQDEFVPVAEIPAADQLPAAPLLISAYAVAWLLIAAYVWLLWRQLGRVERELHTLRARLANRGR